MTSIRLFSLCALFFSLSCGPIDQASLARPDHMCTVPDPREWVLPEDPYVAIADAGNGSDGGGPTDERTDGGPPRIRLPWVGWVY